MNTDFTQLACLLAEANTEQCFPSISAHDDQAIESSMHTEIRHVVNAELLAFEYESKARNFEQMLEHLANVAQVITQLQQAIVLASTLSEGRSQHLPTTTTKKVK